MALVTFSTPQVNLPSSNRVLCELVCPQHLWSQLTAHSCSFYQAEGLHLIPTLEKKSKEIFYQNKEKCSYQNRQIKYISNRRVCTIQEKKSLLYNQLYYLMLQRVIPISTIFFKQFTVKTVIYSEIYSESPRNS